MVSETEPDLFTRELEIEGGVAQAGEALRDIRQRRLYKQGQHSSFDAYCRDRWGWSRVQASRIIAAQEAMQEIAETFAELRGVNDKCVPNGYALKERSVRELRRVPKEQRAKVLEQASAKTGGKITAKAVREAWEDAPPLTVVDVETGEIVEEGSRREDDEDREWVEAEGTRKRLEQCTADIRFRLRNETTGVRHGDDRDRSTREWKRCAELLAELAALVARRCPDAVWTALAAQRDALG